MILGKDYSDDPEIASLLGDAFGVGPARVDDPSCAYIGFLGISHYTGAVRLSGRPAVMLSSIAVCEWGIPLAPNADLCSQKDIYFFQTVEPLELLKVSLAAFVEPQDRGWRVFNAATAYEPCRDMNRKSIFFGPKNIPSNETPINESPVIIKVRIVDLIQPENWSRPEIANVHPESSYYGIAHVDEILKGGLAWHAISVLVDALVGRCVQPLRIGDAGILVGSANDVSGGRMRFLPLLNNGAL
jgi:hypothetical protein